MKKESFIAILWKLLYPVLIHFGITLVVNMGFSVITAIGISTKMIADNGTLDYALYMEKLLEKTYEQSMLVTCISALAAFPIIMFIYKKDAKSRNEEYNSSSITLKYIYIIPLAVCSCMGINNLITISNISAFFPKYNEVSKALYSGGIVFEILGACVAAPVIEELIFRGIIYKRSEKYMKPVWAMVLSSIIFGLYHMNVVQGIYAFCIGMVFSFVYYKYKNLSAPIMAHATANFISVLMSETDIFKFLYQNNLTIILSTIAEIAIMAAILWIINKSIDIKLLSKEA